MKKCVLFVICCVLLISMMGCSSSKKTNYPVYDENATVSTVASGVIASNAEYELIWDETAYCVMLKNIQTGKIWSNIPYEYLQEGGSSANVNSTINIQAAKQENLSWNSYRGYSDAVQNGKVTCEKVENGIRIPYYFESVQISVPVIYTLGAKSLDVTVDAQNISEGDAYKIISVSVAPFMCSALNENEDSYLMVPSGSGALIYAKETVAGTRKYSGNVYGDDLSRSYHEITNQSEALRLPVFGAKNGEDAILCVMKGGAETAVVEAEAGNSRTGYSTVYATYYIRGYDNLATSTYNKAVLGGGDYYSMASSTRTAINPTLSYFPLAGEDASYNGMAKCYREYLESTGGLVKTANTAGYGLTVLGGAQITDSFLGIPHSSTVAATTFAQAQSMLETLAQNTAAKPTVRLVGFGNRGVNPGGVAGGFSFPSIYGNDASRSALEAYCSEQGISLFSDFDVVRFSLSGNGFSTTTDVAKSASLRKVVNYPLGTPRREYLRNYSYNLLSRDLLPSVTKKLLNMADKKNVSGISLMTLGHLAYSDFADPVYASKGNTQNDVSAAIKTLLDGGHIVAGGPNAYSAAASTVVFDVPTDNGGNFVFDAEIPFYEMVFRDTKPIFGESVNLSDDMDRAVLKTLAYGANLSFSILYEYDVNFSETDMLYLGMGATKLYACDFSANEELINEVMGKYGALYTKIADATIVSYTALSDAVTETVFDNGVTLYVNHSKTAADSPVGELAGFEVRY